MAIVRSLNDERKGDPFMAEPSNQEIERIEDQVRQWSGRIAGLKN